MLSKTIEIVAYIDNYSKEGHYDGKPVYSFQEFIEKNILFDYLVVANVYSNEVYIESIGKVESNKIV